MPTATYPQRITYSYLVEKLPTLETAAEFDVLIAQLQARGWKETESSNFRGLMEQLLAPDVRKHVRDRRRAT